jgi:hypothetical protein
MTPPRKATDASGTTKRPRKAAAAAKPKPSSTAPVIEPDEDHDDVSMSIDFMATDEPDQQDEPTEPKTQNSLVDAEGNPLRESVVDFHGRQIRVATPDEVQLAVIKMFADEYGDIKPGTRIELNKIISMSKQAILCVQSVMIDEDDRQWVKEQLLARRIDLQAAMVILNDAMKQLRIVNSGNRAERRAAEKKARLITND